LKKQKLKRFQIKDLGNVKFFLSNLVECDRETRTIFLSKQTYMTQILHRFSMDHSKGCSTLLDPKTKLHLRTEVEESTEIQTYQEAVGSLTYAAIMTRPDIAYTAPLVGHFAANLSTLPWQAVKRILQYVQVTKGYHLLLGAGKEAIFSEQLTIQVLKVYTDADFTGEMDDIKSSSSFVIIGPYRGTVNWRSRTQHSVAKSTADAVFNCTTLVAEEGIWLQKFQTELSPANYKKSKYSNIKLYNDNQACITGLTNSKFCASTRHAGVHHFWLKEIKKTGEVEIGYLTMHKMVADGLTKALDKRKHELFVTMLGMY